MGEKKATGKGATVITAIYALTREGMNGLKVAGWQRGDQMRVGGEKMRGTTKK